MKHNEIQEALQSHVGEKVFIEHKKHRGLEYEDCYDYAVISRLDPAHLIVIVAFNNELLTEGIPYSAIKLVAKSHLYFHDESGEVLFRASQVKEETTSKVPSV